jgi:hypothetical protein
LCGVEAQFVRFGDQFEDTEGVSFDASKKVTVGPL